MRNRPWIALTFLLVPAVLGGCSGGKSGESGAYAPNIGGGAETENRISAQDERIMQAVQTKLDADSELKSAGVKAKVAVGQVELAGTVSNPELKQKAEDLTFDALQEFQESSAGVLNTIEVKEN